MRRENIIAGKIYSRSTGIYGPQPVVFLEDKAATKFTKEFGVVPPKPNTYYQVGRTSIGTKTGYPALVANLNQRADALAALEVVNLQTELDRYRKGNGPSSPALYFELICNLREIDDADYHEERRIYNEKARRLTEQREEREARSRALRQRAQEAARGLQEAAEGVPGIAWEGNGATLTSEAAERITELLKEHWRSDYKNLEDHARIFTENLRKERADGAIADMQGDCFAALSELHDELHPWVEEG